MDAMKDDPKYNQRMQKHSIDHFEGGLEMSSGSRKQEMSKQARQAITAVEAKQRHDQLGKQMEFEMMNAFLN